jgi:hypothetical protein
MLFPIRLLPTYLLRIDWTSEVALQKFGEKSSFFFLRSHSNEIHSAAYDMSDHPPAPAEYTQRLLFPIVELSRGENGYVTLSFNPKQGGQPHDLPAMLIVKEMVFQGFIPKGFQQQLGTLLAQSQNLIRVHECSWPNSRM